jgi:UDP-N-acetylmuramoyl-L-alanyl-D-glutamate--2,6-diaminopimelate ligase
VKSDEAGSSQGLSIFPDRRIESKAIHHPCRRAQPSPSDFDTKPWWIRTRYQPSQQKRQTVYSSTTSALPSNQINVVKRRHPSNQLYVIGITGTNGKTTVSYLIGQVLKAAGYNPFVLGTLSSGGAELSTPVAKDIQTHMYAHLENGGTHFIMEVTSEGIHQSRIIDIDFDVKLLTNITPDHLDYHKTFEIYQQVKLNFMAEGDSHKVYPKTFHAEEITFPTKLFGEFNLLNVKAAAYVLRLMGISELTIRDTLSSCLPPAGRLENVDCRQPYLVFVDFAHTPDALENVLKTAKDIALLRKGKLLVLFGCGGNRDQTKRPKMGKIASELADYAVITEDNSRLESGQKIMEEIKRGIKISRNNYILIPNRREAISFIINQAKAPDVILLAGKGHETHQTIGEKREYFDDRIEAKKAIIGRQKSKKIPAYLAS